MWVYTYAAYGTRSHSADFVQIFRIASLELGESSCQVCFFCNVAATCQKNKIHLNTRMYITKVI